MSCQAIISDWNGTLYRDRDEEAILRAIAVDVAVRFLPWKPEKFWRMLKTRQELENLKRLMQADSSDDPVVEMFRVYNEKVLKGASLALIKHSVDKYAARRYVQKKIIHPALGPISECHDQGILTGILSSGYRDGIQAVLNISGHGSSFDFCEANPLAAQDGRATGIKLEIYKNKSAVLLDLLKKRGLDPGRVVYLGDSLDDSGCFEIAGHPVVSFLSTPGLKELFARRYKAFVPRDEGEFRQYLRSLRM